MPSYTITEPHPTVVKNSYTHSGRGGAGNFFRAPATTPASGVPIPAAATAPTTSTRFYSGRGGAGNIHSAADRKVISFDEEFQRAEVREKASTMTHVGRGGAGNVFSTKLDSSAGSTTRRDSESTTGSTRSGFWHRLSHVGSH